MSEYVKEYIEYILSKKEKKDLNDREREIVESLNSTTLIYPHNLYFHMHFLKNSQSGDGSVPSDKSYKACWNFITHVLAIGIEPLVANMENSGMFLSISSDNIPLATEVEIVIDEKGIGYVGMLEKERKFDFNSHEGIENALSYIFSCGSPSEEICPEN